MRRTALGVFKPVDMPARDIERLKALSLMEDYNDGLRLTPTRASVTNVFQEALPSAMPKRQTNWFLDQWPSFLTKQ